MKRYKHAYTVAFLVTESAERKGEDVTEQQVYDAIVNRAKFLLESGELLAVVGEPFDTCIMS